VIHRKSFFPLLFLYVNQTTDPKSTRVSRTRLTAHINDLYIRLGFLCLKNLETCYLEAGSIELGEDIHQVSEMHCVFDCSSHGVQFKV